MIQQAGQGGDGGHGGDVGNDGVDDPSDIPIGEPITMAAQAGMPAAIHLFDADSIDALSAAYATGRPLLISGEPGIGKSQVARACAAAMRRTLITHMVEPRTEPQDLRYRFDAVGRLADAQAGARDLQSKVVGRNALDPIHYIEPGPLWWTLNWASAQEQIGRLHGHCQRAPARAGAGGANGAVSRGVVLLIDEIDKADSDVPNSLLDALGNRRFQVPWLENDVVLADDMPEPMMIITTNEERELPVAFVRRCVVLSMTLPSDLQAWLVQCARAHLACWRAIDPAIPACSDQLDKLLQQACRLLLDMRAGALENGQRPPAIAEYLDLVRAVLRHKQYSATSADSLLDRMAKYTLAKSKGKSLR